MLSISADTFYATSADVQKIMAAINRSQGDYPPSNLVSKGDCDTIFHTINHLNRELTKLNCRASLATINKIAKGMDEQTLTYGVMINLLAELDGRIRDELGEAYVFALTAAEAALFDPAEPHISRDFTQRFPTAQYDVEECTKCIALGRGTASVFHAMRVLERGIAAIALCLSIPDPIKPSERNWAKMLKSIWEAIEEKWPTVADRDVGDGHLFESLHATLTAIRNPWRNKTMHPSSKYTESEALKIGNAVAQFMDELSKRCDEKGLPLA